MENENKNNPIPFPSWILVFMTLSVPFLYVVGYFYQHGYLSRFGLTNDFFRGSIEDYLIVAFMAFYELFDTILGINFIYLVLTIFVIIGYAVFLEIVGKKVAKLKNVKRHDYVLLSFFIGGLCIFIVCLFTVYCSIPRLAVTGGKKIANERIQEFKGCNEETKDYNCVYLYSDGCLEESGFLVGRSQTHIAIYNGKQSRVFPLKDREVRANVKPSESIAPKK